MNTTKICCKCKQCKPLEEFTRDKKNKDGRTYDCKACRSVIYKQWMADNPEKVKATRDKNWAYRKDYYQRPEQKLKYRKRFIEKKYGISYDEYEKMVDEQGNVCYICNRPEPQERNEHLAVDHNHKTGKVRGLLCSRCNRVIGLLEEDLQLIEKLKNYIKKHKEI
jgi:hypothetical protein